MDKKNRSKTFKFPRRLGIGNQTLKRTQIPQVLFLLVVGIFLPQYIRILTSEYLWFVCMHFFCFLKLMAYNGKNYEVLSFIGFIWPWLWTTAEFLCWSQINVLQFGACSSPVDSCKLQFICIILTSGDIFAILPFPVQIIGLCQSKSEVFLSGVFKVDFDLVSHHAEFSEVLTWQTCMVSLQQRKLAVLLEISCLTK